MKLFIAFGVFAIFAGKLAFAQSAQEIQTSPDWAKASVITDGGAVYQQPDFDSPVIEYLGFNAGIWILKKPVPGAAGLGLFHRVRFKNKAGYIADTDVRVSGKDFDQARKKEQKTGVNKGLDKKHRSQAWEKEEAESDGGDPLYFKRYVGLALSVMNFSEKFSGKKFSSQMVMGGLRLTGPGVLFDGPPLDVNIWFTTQAPSYYSKILATDVKGFMLFGDVMVVLPFIEAKDSLYYYGIGMMWTYPNYKVTIKNSHFDSQELRVGGEFGIGGAWKLAKSFALRLDGRYYIEKTQYFSGFTSFQTEF